MWGRAWSRVGKLGLVVPSSKLLASELRSQDLWQWRGAAWLVSVLGEACPYPVRDVFVDVVVAPSGRCWNSDCDRGLLPAAVSNLWLN